MTGREVLAQVREALAPYRYHADCSEPDPDDFGGCEHRPLGVAAVALDGCVLLTREEAATIRRCVDDLEYHHGADGHSELALALLTPEEPS